MKYKYAITPLLLSISSLAASYFLTWQHEWFAALVAFALSAVFAAAGKQTFDSATAPRE